MTVKKQSKAIALAAAALLLASCAPAVTQTGEYAEAVAGIAPTCETYKGGDAVELVEATGEFNSQPTVTFPFPISGTGMETRILIEGNGGLIVGSQRVGMHFAGYNATHLANEDKIVIYDKNGRWDGSNYFGVSLLSLDKLGKKYNYSLIYCNKNGVNCFLIHNDIIKNKDLQFKNLGDIEKIYKPAGYSNGPNGGHPQDIYNRKYISFDEAINI